MNMANSKVYDAINEMSDIIASSSESMVYRGRVLYDYSEKLEVINELLYTFAAKNNICFFLHFFTQMDKANSK